MPMFNSIVLQLEFLLDQLERRPRDLPRLRQVNVGLYAVRELTETDPVFAEQLTAAQFIADRLGAGLKP